MGMATTLPEVLNDLRFALRQMRKQPGVAASAIATLALGIGASTAVFSLLYGALLKPLPYLQPQRIVFIHNVFPKARTAPSGVSTVDYVELKKHPEVFSDVAEYYFNDLTLTGAGAAKHVDPVNASASFFRILGVKPALGRAITEEDDRYGAPKVALLSDKFWRSAFNGDRHVIGRTIRLDEVPYTIIGVMPQQFQFPYPATQIWLPLALTPTDLEGKGRLDRWAFSIARLAPGVTKEKSAGALRVIGHQLAARLRQFPEFFPEKEDWHFSTAPLVEEQTRSVRNWILLAFGAVFLVLLIACSNVSGLLLIRALSRSTEMAVRAAMGASKTRIFQQVLTETALLVCIGSALGLVVASWLVDLSNRYGPFAQAAKLQGPSVLFGAVTALFCTVLTGLLPAFVSTSLPLEQSLKSGATRMATSGSRLRFAAVAGQVALAVTLLFTATLLSRSFMKLLAVSPGFEAKHVWSGLIQLPQKLYKAPDVQLRFFQNLQEKAAQLPGVESASASAPLPFTYGVWSLDLSFPGRPELPNQPRAEAAAVLPGYFGVMRIPLRRGRTFTTDDKPPLRPVSVINEEFARVYFPGEDPIGKQVGVGGDRDRPTTIIGIVGDVENSELGGPRKPQIYGSVLYEPVSAMCLVVRTRGDVDITNAVRSEVTKLDPHVALFDVATMDERVGHSLQLRRFVAFVLNAFGGVGLLLAALGIYASLAHLVVLRRREIGIRIALGAAWQNVAGLVWQQGLSVMGAGTLAGTIGAVTAGALLRNEVFGVSTYDDVTWAVVFGVLALMAALAAWLPTHRALKIQPTEALREE